MANSGGVYTWSRIANNNQTFDSTVNWQEGQAPSTVNDSARAMMASAAKWRDDIAGAIVTSGSSTAYTVGSYQVFDTLADMSGMVIAFSPHTTNGATVTLNVDSLGAKPLRSSPGVELAAGTLIQGTPYTCVFSNSDGAFYLQNFFGANPYNVPLAAGMDYWGSSTPNSSFAFPAGQAISRTTYAALFAIMSTTYGVGDGSTTFNLPDKTGRVSAMKEASATRLTSSWFGGNSTNLGATGGSEKNALSATNQLPQFTPSGTVTTATTDSAAAFVGLEGASNQVASGSGFELISRAINSSFSGNAIGSASPSSFTTTQPTIICNYIIRVL